MRAARPVGGSSPTAHCRACCAETGRGRSRRWKGCAAAEAAARPKTPTMQGSKRHDCSMVNDQMTAPRRPTPTGPMRLHLFRPAAAGRYPGILLYLEIYQIPGPIRRMAAFLAGQGYLVAAPRFITSSKSLALCRPTMRPAPIVATSSNSLSLRADEHGSASDRNRRYPRRARAALTSACQ